MQSIFKTIPKLFQRASTYQSSLPKHISTAIPIVTPIKDVKFIPTQTKPLLDPAFKVRKMTLDDVKTVFEWASEESWFLSPHDAEVCYRSHPQGLFAGDIKGETMCSHVCLQYGDYYFLTLHITKSGYRFIGYGKKIFEFTKSFYKDGKVIFFDAADEGIPLYTKLGYKDYCWIKTYKKEAIGTLGPNIIDLREIPFQELINYDLDVFGYPREKLLKSILQEKTYRTLAVKKEGKLKGFGLLRKCQKDVGYALSALYADDKEIARELMESLQSFVAGQDVYMEVFDCNPKALELINEQGWNLQFECKRMYGGEAPKMDSTRMYGDYCF